MCIKCASYLSIILSILSQWDYDGAYSTNYSENEIDLATVLMNLKEDYPSPVGSCNDHQEPTYYDPMTTGADQQHHHQVLQWQSPPCEQPQHVLVYDSLDSDYVRPSHENCLLPTILGRYLRQKFVYNTLYYSLWPMDSVRRCLGQREEHSTLTSSIKRP